MIPTPPSPLKALELRQLRYFLILARELHFGRAADLAFVTQPALSQQIAKLEQLVGVQLFTRDPRGVTLTLAGKELCDGIDKAFVQIDAALKSAREVGQSKAFTLAIGLVEFTNLPFIPPALIRLQALYPEVNIVRHEMNASQQIVSLTANEIDVGFGVPIERPGPKTRVRGELLLESGWCLLMRSNHRLAQRERLRIEDLAGERLIIPARAVNEPLYDSLLVRLSRASVKANIVYETTQSQVGVSLVDQGLGTFLGAAYVFASVPESLIYRPVDGFDPLAVEIFSRADENNVLVLDFIELASEEARRMQAYDWPRVGASTSD